MFAVELKCGFFTTIEKLMGVFPNHTLISLAIIWRHGNYHEFANYCSYLIEANPGIGSLPICKLPAMPIKI